MIIMRDFQVYRISFEKENEEWARRFTLSQKDDDDNNRIQKKINMRTICIWYLTVKSKSKI